MIEVIFPAGFIPADLIPPSRRPFRMVTTRTDQLTLRGFRLSRPELTGCRLAGTIHRSMSVIRR